MCIVHFTHLLYPNINPILFVFAFSLCDSRSEVGDPPALQHVAPDDDAAQSARLGEGGLQAAHVAGRGGVTAGGRTAQQLHDETRPQNLLSQRLTLSRQTRYDVTNNDDLAIQYLVTWMTLGMD